MRDYDEEDPKKPQPISRRAKGESALEAQEHGFRNVRPDRDEHRDRHVRS